MKFRSEDIFKTLAMFSGAAPGRPAKSHGETEKRAYGPRDGRGGAFRSRMLVGVSRPRLANGHATREDVRVTPVPLSTYIYRQGRQSAVTSYGVEWILAKPDFEREPCADRRRASDRAVVPSGNIGLPYMAPVRSRS
jgi:hypothetical protein